MVLQDFLELTPKKDVLFIIGDWNAKVGSQQTPGVTDLCVENYKILMKDLKAERNENANHVHAWEGDRGHCSGTVNGVVERKTDTHTS